VNQWSGFAWAATFAPARGLAARSARCGLVGEYDDPCLQGLCPDEPQGCLLNLPEEQGSPADEDGVDHEPELVEQLVLQQRRAARKEYRKKTGSFTHTVRVTLSELAP
jgi:hypothetical protein